VAVKVLHPILRNRGAEELQRFIQEGVSASRLSHPNAVSVFDSGLSPGGVAYLVMELLHGRSLAEELRETKMLSVERCLAIAVPVCRVLAEAHEVGVLHRDIKPENIFLHRVKDEEVVKVVDFGIAKLVRGDEADEPVSQRLLAGTPHYLAPERLEQGGHDGRADVYSLGVTLYRMLGGALPFEAESFSGWLATLARFSPAPLQSLNPDVPPALSEAVMRAMAKNPAERPTARELEPMLRKAVAKDG
jgi:serine/threonine protein kinase